VTPGEPAGRVPGPGFPVGVNLRSIGVTVEWWRAQAVRLEAAGYAGVWTWDHFVSRGTRTDPVLEAWKTLAFAAAATSRITTGTFVANVMNRHPAVLARMAATFQEASGGRLVLGIGIGGHPAEHEAYGIPFPLAEERVERLEEAVAVLRALWAGGPVSREGRYYPLRDAYAYPVPDPPPPIIIGGETTAGARLAARIGDGWTSFSPTFERDLPTYLDGLRAAGRDRASQRVLVGFQWGKGDWSRGEGLTKSPWVLSPAEEAARWRAAGADGAVVSARTTEEVDALIGAAQRR
jgi:alkanesulfonate monooxygenase SsuD/methylene tetrahydromethanopterin reductase-like flavin-dependent oxidoreductase (luciferase family)